MTTTSATDMGPGLGLVFSVLAIVAAAGTAVLGYQYALLHAAEEAARGVQLGAAGGFAVSMTAAILAVAAIHAYYE